MYRTLDHFKERYKHLQKKGLRIQGIKLVDPEKKTHVIEVSRPLIFDSRMIPDRYEGLKVKRRIHGPLPDEFQIDREEVEWHKKEYIWAPERFERYVDRCADMIRKKLGNPEMSREDMLDALCFGDFEEHKKKVHKLVAEGKLPTYS
ncbi:MAG: hypothetical protein RIC15_08715 [Vicingaceae bacterium]